MIKLIKIIVWKTERVYKLKVMEKETFFETICSKFNIDSQVKKNAYKQLAEINRTTILQVSNWN